MKRPNKGSLLVVLVVVIALLGGVIAGFFIFPMLSQAGGAPMPLASSSQDVHDASTGKAKSREPGMMYPIKERVVTLGDPGIMRYLKIEIVLEFELQDAKGLKGEAYKKRQDEFVKEMASRRPLIDDVITTILSSKTSAMLTSADGKENLRDELKAKLGEIADEHKLLNVYFTQFIIQ